MTRLQATGDRSRYLAALWHDRGMGDVDSLGGTGDNEDGLGEGHTLTPPQVSRLAAIALGSDAAGLFCTWLEEQSIVRRQAPSSRTGPLFAQILVVIEASGVFGRSRGVWEHAIERDVRGSA